MSLSHFRRHFVCIRVGHDTELRKHNELRDSEVRLRFDKMADWYVVVVGVRYTREGIKYASLLI